MEGAIAGTAEQSASVRFRRSNWHRRDRALILQLEAGQRDYEAFQGYTARLSGLAWREAFAVGVLMNTRGLMELVFLNVGLDLGIISPELFTIMVTMALATTVMTTPLLALAWPPPIESSGRHAVAAVPSPVEAAAL